MTIHTNIPRLSKRYPGNRFAGFGFGKEEVQAIVAGIAVALLLTIMAWGTEPVQPPEDWHGNSYRAPNR